MKTNKPIPVLATGTIKGTTIIYASMQQCANRLGVSYNTVTRYLKTGKEINGFILTKVER